MRNLQTDLPAMLLVVLLAALTLTLRGFMPFDETRYIAVAWEMWHGHHWLIPTINGNVYAEKPPLLFWLVNLGWSMFGVNEWWPRTIPFIFVLLNLMLARIITARLWPELVELQQLVPLMLLCLPVWFVYATPFMFDMVQTFFVLTAVYGLMIYRNKQVRAFMIFGVACGLGMLLKGPVILVYVLPLALGIPFWNDGYRPDQRRFLVIGISTGLLVSLLVFATWLIPVIQVLGPERVRAEFLHQTADRMLRATSHARPFWWYLPFLPLVVFPWAWKISFWRSGSTRKDRSERKKWLFLMLWMIPPFIFLTLISAKQLHYLLPLLPPLVIAMAVLLTERHTPVRPQDNHIAGCVFVLFGLGFYLYRTFTLHGNNQWLDQLSPLLPVLAIAAGLLLIFIKSGAQLHSIKIMALGTLVFLYAVYVIVLSAPRPFTRIDEISRILAVLQKQDIPLGFAGGHREQFSFPGRMTKPLDKVAPRAAADWAKSHPDGFIVFLYREPGPYRELQPYYAQPYRFRQNLALLSCRDILREKNAF